VTRGQVLVRLDPADAEARVAKAEADLAAARNRMVAAEAAAAAADAERKAADVEVWRSQRELERAESLALSHAASTQDLDRARATRDAAEARVRALALHAEAERAVLGNQAPVRQAEADLSQARLNLSHTQLTAPFDGIVGRKNVEPGAVLAAGQPLLALTADQDSWVIANFKETQIQRMRVGQPTEVRVDAYPGVVWRGHVDSFSPATGAKYALIPPDHASGNFTKVVQRVPVKVVLDAAESTSGDPLPAALLAGNGPAALPIGLSAEVKVVVR
jgi:membrane fusion protein (multidrug efflux system)